MIENITNQEESLNYLKNLGLNVPKTFRNVNITEVKEYMIIGKMRERI